MSESNQPQSVSSGPSSDEEKSSAPVAGPERPILSSAEDKLEREPFVRRISAALINSSTGKASGTVIGITGPWGSGKSSILNLLKAHLQEAHPTAIVVSFDPWLVSGREDLISAFINELMATIKAEPTRATKLKNLTETFAEYGELLSPLANFAFLGAGAVASGGFKAIKNAVHQDKSLSTLRKTLLDGLAKCDVPIIVLIDELDRVEDAEIRTVAQLVRSVADFPGISYVLAYDHDRVVEALGLGVAEDRRSARGQAYLEKIVQIQIPLPITLDEEVLKLLEAELGNLQPELRLPADFSQLGRFRDLVGILVPQVIQTPRDIKRLVGTFHVMCAMLRTEVDWVDLLAYCAVMIKSPKMEQKIRAEPDIFAEDALSIAAAKIQAELGKLSYEDRLARIMPDGENNIGIRRLIGYLFRTFSDKTRRPIEYADPLCLRRPLLTTLRLGLLPGGFSRLKIEELFKKTPEQIERTLREAYAKNELPLLVDRIDDLYASATDINHVQFWKGIARFLRKPDCEWMTSFQPMHDITNNFAGILLRAVEKDEAHQTIALSAFSNLRGEDEDVLTVAWLRTHIFMYGLFGREKRKEDGAFLTADQTDAQVRDMCIALKQKHMMGQLIPCRWNLQPVYMMIDFGTWDDLCREKIDEAIATDDRALEGFTLMLFGSFFTTDMDVVKKMCSIDAYIERVMKRLQSPSIKDVDESVRAALQKAANGGW